MLLPGSWPRAVRVAELYAAPGNPGMAKLAQCVPLEDPRQILAFAKEKSIDLTVVGPECYLAAGIGDLFAQAGLPLFGPTKEAAQLESSKSFCQKDLPQIRHSHCRLRSGGKLRRRGCGS